MIHPSRQQALTLYRAPVAGPWDDGPRPVQWCLLCGSTGPPAVRADSCCATCGSPLASPPEPDLQAPEPFGRRGSLRRGRDHVASVHLGWPSTPFPVRWRDLSLTGLSVLAERALPSGRTIRVSDAGIDLLAEVVACRPIGRLHTVHARLLRARFLQTSGVFVSARA